MPQPLDAFHIRRSRYRTRPSLRAQERFATARMSTRRRLINAAKALRDSGLTPPGVDNPEFYARRSGCVILHNGVDWQTATRELQKAFITHQGLSEDPFVILVGAQE